MTELEELRVDGNRLRSLHGLSFCGKLRDLSACGNDLRSLEGLPGSGQLETLAVDGNGIESLGGAGGPRRRRRPAGRLSFPFSLIPCARPRPQCCVLRGACLSAGLPESLPQLSDLSVARNRLTSLSGLVRSAHAAPARLLTLGCTPSTPQGSCGRDALR